MGRGAEDEAEPSGQDSSDAKPRPGSWRDLGYPRPVAYNSVNVWLRYTHTWGAPLLARGRKGPFDERDALPLLHGSDRVEVAVREFDAAYSVDKEQVGARAPGARSAWRRNGFLYALLRVHTGELIGQCAWALIEIASRVLAPYALRQLVRWLILYSEGQDMEERTGWLWVAAVSALGLLVTISHHQLFWIGMRLGFRLKQQVRRRRRCCCCCRCCCCAQCARRTCAICLVLRVAPYTAAPCTPGCTRPHGWRVLPRSAAARHSAALACTALRSAGLARPRHCAQHRRTHGE